MSLWLVILILLLFFSIAGLVFASYLIAERFADLHGALGQPLAKPLLRLAHVLEGIALRLQTAFTPPAQRCFNLAHGHLVSRLMHAAVKHGIPDAFGQEPRSASAVAEELKLDEASVQRLLRVLSAHGCFAAVDGTEQMYRHNAVSSLLRRDHPVSLRPWLVMLDGGFNNWEQFDGVKGKEGVETGDDEDEAQGPNGRTRRPPPWSTVLREAELSRNRLDDGAVLDDVEWSQFSRVIDLGGDHGHFLSLLLRSNPKLVGVLCEPSDRLERTRQVWARRHQLLGERVQFHEASVLGAIPKPMAGDAIVIRHQLAGLSDEEAIEILRGLRASLGKSDATLVVVDVMVREAGDSATKLLFDLQAHAEPGARARSESAWRALLASCAFRVKSLTHVRGLCSVICAQTSSAAKAQEDQDVEPERASSAA